MSVPNQKTLIIHQSEQIPFLKIGVQELMDAYKEIKTPSAFVLYLYLASNKDGYKLELSREALKNATGYSKSSYHRAVEQLSKLGYIYEDNGSLNFATVPKIGKRGVIQNWDENNSNLKQPIVKKEAEGSQICNTSYSEMNTEIDNKEIINKQIKTDIPIHEDKDYSYLDECVSDDGSYSWKGEIGFLDGNDDPDFYSRPKSFQAKKMKEITPFNEGEIKYILNNII